MLIDSHSHLDLVSQSAKENIGDIIKQAHSLGVSHILQISTSTANFETSLAFANKFENVSCSIGVHPLYLEYKNDQSHCDLSSNSQNSTYSTLSDNSARSSCSADGIIQFNTLSHWLKHDNVVAIGETGFDFYRIGNSASEKKSAYKVQRENLEVHVLAAQEYDLPLIIHTRSADEETIDFLTSCYKKKAFKGVIHCFTSTEHLAFKMLDIGFYISASGVVTFKNAENIRSTIAKIPSNMLLIETDSPYLSPSPVRGKVNRPEHIIHTARFLSELRNEDYEKFCTNTTNNFFTLFDKVKKLY